MNAKLDPSLLRATSAEHAIECSRPRLELVTEDEIPSGAVTYASTRWERLDRENATIILARVAGSDRVGVTTFYAGKYVSYHECSRAEANEATGNFQRAGFSGPRPYEVRS